MGLFRIIKNMSQEKKKQKAQIVENVRQLFETEFEIFRETTLKKSKEEIFDTAIKIRFYQNIHDYVQDEDTLDYDTAIKICTVTPISELWDNYLDSEFLEVDSYEDIEQLFEETFSCQKGIVCRLGIEENATDHCLYA